MLLKSCDVSSQGDAESSEVTRVTEVLRQHWDTLEGESARTHATFALLPPVLLFITTWHTNTPSRCFLLFHSLDQHERPL